MNFFCRLRPLALIIAILVLNPAPALYAKNKKAEKFYKEGMKAEARKEFEQALALYDKALGEDPSDPAYNLSERRMRVQVGQIHMTLAKKLRDGGSLDQALLEYQKAFSADPSNALALQEIQRTTEMIDRNKRGVKPGEEALTPVEVARKDEMERISSIMPLPRLKPITARIDTLKMNNQPTKVLYETVGKYAGINVIFDPQMQPAAKNINVDITNSSVEEALDYIALETKTFWKPVSSNAIFVTEDSVTKRRDYEDNVVKVFYLKNVTSVQELQEMVTAVRSIADTRLMFTYAAQNAVVLRGTADRVALAEKLFHDLDKPKAEVVVDIMVMQANSDRTKTLAMGLVGSATGATGLELPIQFSPRNPVLTGTTTTTTTGTGTGTTGTGTTGTGTTGTGTTGTGTGVPTTGTTTSTSSYISTAQIGHVGLNDFSIALPGALLQAIASDTTTRILQSPQVRSSDGQKVTFKVGQKIPYASGSFNAGITGGIGSVSPLVSTQFQFADVGVEVTMTPHVHGTDEVTLNIAVGISSVAQELNIGGIQQPVIAQQKNEAEIRLRDGQVSIMGGLTQLQNTKTLAGIPGLVSIPILGTILGGSNQTDKSHSELLIALIPHIVRTPPIDPLDLRGVVSGTDQVIHLNYAPEAPTAATPPAPAAPAAITPAVPQPSVPGGAPAVVFTPAAANVPLGGPLNVTLSAANVSDLLAASPIHLKWDPKLLRLNEVAPGNFLKQDGQNPPIIDIRNENGEATISVSRTGPPGVNGSGVLAQLTFTAIGKGSGALTVTEAALKNSQRQPIAAALPALKFTVQ